MDKYAVIDNKHKMKEAYNRPVFLCAGYIYVALLLASKFFLDAITIFSISALFVAVFILAFKINIKATAIVFASIAGLACIIIFNFYQYTVVKPIKAYTGSTYSITGTVKADPIIKNGRSYITLKNIKLNGVNNHTFICQISTDSVIPANIGDTVNGSVTFTTVGSVLASSYASNGIFITGYFNNKPNVTINSSPPVSYYINKLSIHCKNVFQSRLQPAEYGAIEAMFLGDKTDLDNNIKSTFNSDGISYIIAIAGMQLTIIVFFINSLLKKIIKKNIIVYVFTILFLLSYILIIGMPLTAVRAGIMLILLLTANQINRSADSLTSLSISVIIILAFNPLSVYSIGFMLSVLATFGVIVLAPKLIDFLKLQFTNRFSSKFIKITLSYIFEIFSLSVACIIFTLPITIIVFGTTAPLSPIISIAIMPFLQILLYSAFIACALSFTPINFLVDFFVIITALATKIIIAIADFFSGLSFTSIVTNQNYILLSIAACFLLLCVYFLIKVNFNKSKNITANKLLVSLCAIIMLSGIVSNNILTAGCSSVTVLDVKNGFCTVISCDGLNIMIGCGGDNYPTSKIKNYLVAHNIKTINQLILPENNEMYSSAAVDIIKNFTVQSVYAKSSGHNALAIEHVKNYISSGKILTENININSKSLHLSVKNGDVYFKINNNDFAIIKPNDNILNGIINSRATVLCGNSLPKNIDECFVDNIIISGDKEYSTLAINKVDNKACKYYATADCGAISMIINANGNMITRRIT